MHLRQAGGNRNKLFSHAQKEPDHCSWGRRHRGRGGTREVWGGGRGPALFSPHGGKVLKGLSLQVPKPPGKNYFPASLPTEKRTIDSQKPWAVCRGLTANAGEFRLASKGSVMRQPSGSEWVPWEGAEGLPAPSLWNALGKMIVRDSDGLFWPQEIISELTELFHPGANDRL